MKIKSRIKRQNGSISLFVLVSMMFFLVILIGIYINTNNKVQRQEKQIQQIQQSYNQQDINELYEETYNNIN